MISPSPVKDKWGKDVLHVSRCLERSELTLSPLMCSKEYGQIDKQTDQLESQSWAVIGITVTNVIGLIIHGLLTCKKRSSTSTKEDGQNKVYHYVGKRKWV